MGLTWNRMESINFVHDVNVMRKTFKSVYSESADLRALNNEIGESGPGNCRVQILPVLWRHLLDFPKRRQRKAEYDIGDDISEDDECKFRALCQSMPTHTDAMQIPRSRTSPLRAWPSHDLLFPILP